MTIPCVPVSRSVRSMDPVAEPPVVESTETTTGEVDLVALERIEGELHAVERALEQIDQGVFDGFAGLDQVAEASAAEAPTTDPSR